MSELNTAHGLPRDDEPPYDHGTEREQHAREIMSQVEQHTARLNLLPNGGGIRIVLDQVAREILRGLMEGPGYTRPDREAHDAALDRNAAAEREHQDMVRSENDDRLSAKGQGPLVDQIGPEQQLEPLETFVTNLKPLTEDERAALAARQDEPTL